MIGKLKKGTQDQATGMNVCMYVYARVWKVVVPRYSGYSENAEQGVQATIFKHMSEIRERLSRSNKYLNNKSILLISYISMPGR